MKKLILITIGGFIGAICRYVIKNLPISGTFPITTIFINTIGCFLLAFVISLTLNKKYDTVKIGITTGFCGAFTTFSTLCKESVQFLQNRMYSQAIIYIILMIFLGLSAVYCGVTSAKMLNNHSNTTDNQNYSEVIEDEVE